MPVLKHIHDFFLQFLSRGTNCSNYVLVQDDISGI